MDPTNPNLDVYQMQADLEAQAAMYSPQSYGNYEADLTQARSSFGDIPAMMWAGAKQAGAMGMGALSGAGNMLSAVGQHVMPASYSPPAKVSTGYYGQYAMNTSFTDSLSIITHMSRAPRGVSAFKWGYNAAADFGERIAGAASSAALVAAGLGTGGMGASLGSVIGGTMGAAFGPIGSGIGGVAGMLGGGLAGYGIADVYASALQQRRNMNAFLESSSFRYVSAGSPMADPRLGQGMGMGSRRQAVEAMRQMDIRDTTLGMEDISGIFQGATSLGLMTGVRDMDDFKSKFKNIVEGVKVVAKTLNTTLQEGLQVMKDFKSIAVDPSQMGRIAFQADVSGMMSGRTAHEVVNLGLQGAELYRGTGIEMKIGYQANVMNIASVRAARDAGLISQELISQAGGEESLAQKLTGTGLSFMQSAMGRGYGAAFFHPGAGPAGFDRGAFMSNLTTGGMNVAQLAMQGATNLRTPSNMITYDAYQDKFMSEMGKAMGGDTTVMLANSAMANARYLTSIDKSLDMKTALRYSLIHDFGRSPEIADTVIARITGAQGEFAKKMEATQTASYQRRIDEALSTRGLGYVLERMYDVGKGALIDPIVRKFDRGADTIKEGMIRSWEENTVGISRFNISDINYAALSGLPSTYDSSAADPNMSGYRRVGYGGLDERSAADSARTKERIRKAYLTALRSGDVKETYIPSTVAAKVLGEDTQNTSYSMLYDVIQEEGKSGQGVAGKIATSFAAEDARQKRSGSPGIGLTNLGSAVTNLDTGWNIMGPSLGRTMLSGIENLSKIYPSLRGITRTGTAKPGEGDIVLKEDIMVWGNREYTSVHQSEIDSLAKIADTQNISIADAQKLVKDGKAVPTAVDLGDLLLKGKLGKAELGVGGSIRQRLSLGDFAGVASALFPDIKKPEDLTRGHLATIYGQLAKYGAGDVAEEHQRNLGRVRGMGEDVLIKELSNLEKDARSMGRRLGSTLWGTSAEGVSAGVTDLYAQARASYEKGTPDGIKAGDSFSKQARDLHYSQTGALRDFSDAARKGDPAVQALVTDYVNTGKRISEIQGQRSWNMLYQSVGQDVTSAKLTRAEEPLVLAGLTEFLQGGISKISKDNLPAFQKSTMGAAIFSQPEVFKTLDKLQEDLKGLHGESRKLKTQETIKELKISDTHRASLIEQSANEDVNLSKFHANQSINLASKAGGTGPREGFLGGTAETKGTMQGGGADQAVTQLNINLEVLTALQALNSLLKGSTGG